MTDDEIRIEMAVLNMPEAKAALDTWLLSRPMAVQEIARKWPGTRPYVIAKPSCPRLPVGTVVGIRSMFEGGEVSIIVLRDKGTTVAGEQHTIDPEVLLPYQLRAH